MTNRAALPIPIVLSQVALLAAAMVVLAGWPPRSGRMMIVALDDAAAARMMPLAIGAHALLLGPGPWHRTYIIDGDRTAVLATLPTAAFIVAAPAAACGDRESAI